MSGDQIARENSITSRVAILFQLRDSSVRILFHFGEKGHTGDALVSPTVLHAALLHKFQHQFPAVRYVRHDVPPLSGTNAAQGVEEHDAISLQSTKVHI